MGNGRKPWVWTEDKRQKIIELRQAGKTAKEIAEAMGSKDYIIRTIELKYNLRTPEKRFYKRWTVQENIDLMTEYYSGMPLKDIRINHGLRTTRAIYSRVQFLLDRGYEPRTSRILEKRRRMTNNEYKVRRRGIFAGKGA